MEPLEVRQVLATVYVNDNWVSADPGAGNLSQGDTVYSSADPLNNSITGSYGDDAFGIVSNATSSTGNPYLTIAGQGVSSRYIDDAIGAAANGDTVSLIEGTYTESDIVIDKAVLFKGSGTSGSGDTIIVPEVVSARAELEFPTGSHQGIIIYSPSVTVTNLHINGSGNGSLGGSLNFHHGITTLYDTQDGVNGVGGTNYVPVRGPNMPVINLGPLVDQHRSEPKLLINNVKVDNVWYKGITLSAAAGYNFGRTGSADENQIQNSIVNTVGDAGNITANHVGILIQNLDDANNDLGNAFGNTVSNVFGIGVASNAYGTRSWNSRAFARNDTTMSFNTVNNASLEGFRNDFLSGGDFIANVANFSGGNTAIGLHSIHSDVTYATFTSNGAKIGAKFEDSSTGVHNAAPIFGINFNLTGPGTTVAGSVGVLADNSLGVNTDTTFLMAQGSNISGFATGVKAVQSLSSVVPTTIFIDRPNVTGNAVGYDFGAGVTVIGQFNTIDPVTNAGASLVPQFLPNLIEQYADQITNQPTPPYVTSSNVTPPTPTVSVATSPKPDTVRTGNLTLGSGATFAPLLNGTPGSQTLILEDFTTAYSYTNVVSEDQINPWRIGFQSPSRLGTWAIGNVTQNGDGTVTVSGGATQLGAVFDLGTAADAQDVTAYQKLQIVVAKGPSGMSAKQFAIGIADQDGTTDVFFFPTAPLNAAGTGVYLTLNVNILAPPVRFQDGDGIMNLSHITGWSASGDLGSTDFDPLKTISIKLDRIEVVKGPKASQADVTGTVNLTGSSLAASIGAQFATSVGQQFTIVNNDGADAVTGTFTGLPQGAAYATGGKNFTISYTGGTGNDVVLTEVNSASSVLGRRIFYNQSSFDGNSAAQGTADDNAIATDKTAYIPQPVATTAVFNNVTSFTRGINGIMVDIGPSGGHTSINANDFVFKVGNNNSPSTWATVTATPTISVRAGAGVSGSDRVTITWASASIRNAWLEVQVLPTANTGLTAADVFFWGNKIGDTGLGTPATTFLTSGADKTQVLGLLGGAVGITSIRDFNRDNSVTGADATVVTGSLGSITRLNVAAAGPFAPEGDGGDSGVASALAASSVTREGSSPAQRLDTRRESDGTGVATARSLAIVRYADEQHAAPWRDVDPDDVDGQELLDDELLAMLVKRWAN